MKPPSIALVCLLLLTCLGGCETEIQNCDNAQQVQTFYNDEFDDTPCDLKSIDDNDKTASLVIKTQADYEKYFGCSGPPAVDFEKYFILAGRYRHNQCAVLDSQKVLLCDGRIVYKVRMLEQICASFTNVYYYTVIDRRYEGLPVVFDVEFSN